MNIQFELTAWTGDVRSRRHPPLLRDRAQPAHLTKKRTSKYSVPKTDFVRWTLDAIDWSGVEMVLDIGPGRGSHYACLMQEQPAQYQLLRS